MRAKDLPPLDARTVARFWSKIDKDGPGGCWVWTGSVTPAGYGQFSIGSRTDKSTRMVKPHRVSYTLLIGPIPNHLTLDHLCRNTRCVNPDHLEPVTLAENAARGQRRDYCRRGHRRTPDNVDARGGCIQCQRDKVRDSDGLTKRDKTCKNGHVRAEVGWHETPTTKVCAACYADIRQRSYDKRRQMTGMKDMAVECRNGHRRDVYGWHEPSSGRRECAECHRLRAVHNAS